MTELRYGVIGTGMMGREHIANISHLPGARVTALADPHPPSLAAAASLAPGPPGSATTATSWPPDSATRSWWPHPT